MRKRRIQVSRKDLKDLGAKSAKTWAEPMMFNIITFTPDFFIMQNDPELSGKYLGTISEDFVKVSDTLKEASYQIRKAGFEFPVFPICKDEQPIGQVLLQRTVNGTMWNYYASYLDEFLQRGLIVPDKVEGFKDAYKDPDEFCCLFVIDLQFTNFVFIPFPED